MVRPNQPPAADTSGTPSVKDVYALPVRFLRAMDPSCFDPGTMQRRDVHFDPTTGEPLEDERQPPCPAIRDCVLDGDVFRLTWSDERRSVYSVHWVRDALRRWRNSAPDSRMPWNELSEQSLRASTELSMMFNDALTDTGMEHALRALHSHGILLVTGTPTEDGGSGVAALASALGGGQVKGPTSLLASRRAGGDALVLPHGTDGPLRTLYGTVWSTTSSGQSDGASVADSSYGSGSLPLHTDMTYLADPPGLQVFTMKSPAAQGGQSVFADGLAAAEALRRAEPEAFAVLSRTVSHYRCVDSSTGWHLQASAPLLTLRAGRVVAIRHNDLDRLVDLPPPELDEAEHDSFYDNLDDARRSFNALLAQGRLVVGLRPGETVVVANQRCLHGRHRFEASAAAPRSVIGCYVSQDELNSRFRMQGLI